MTLEICCSTLADVKSAREGKAQRIELCQGLSTGGLTPTAPFIRHTKEILGDATKIHVLIRTREGNFIYTDDEIDAMTEEIAMAKENGADGVVIGAMTRDNRVDVRGTEKMVKRAKELGLAVTFSRAIDLAADILAATKTVAELGCDRILTSGGAPKAVAGLENIRRMVENVPEGCLIMAASGVNADNCRMIADATGVTELHGSMRAKIDMDPNINTLPGLESDDAATSPTQILKAKENLGIK